MRHAYRGAVVRPKVDPTIRKSDAVQLRLTSEERALFDLLVAARTEELRPEGVTATDAGVLRWLFLREVAARRLDHNGPRPAPEPPKARRLPGSPKKVARG